MRRLPSEPPSAEITPEAAYFKRRELMKNAALFAATAAVGSAGVLRLLGGGRASSVTPSAEPLAGLPAGAMSVRGAYSTDEPRTTFEAITTYNNFYELGLDKADPAANAGSLRLRPWSLQIDGEAHKPQTIDVDTLLRAFPAEERVYRMRCVETWSMVIPWLGFSLADVLRRVEPTSRAKFVAFTTLHNPDQLPGQQRRVLDWPYVEGLRIDEAMHPLTMLAVGLYGKALLGQNGAPLRLVVPWKYGFKGIKSIVKITLTERQPETTWSKAAPLEYGFYANVNPAVDHPRWSQSTERRIGDVTRRSTLPFNGYAEHVAHLYAGMNLHENF